MAKSLVELVVGDLEEKKAWNRMMKRVNALPEDYRFAYKKILNYGYNAGFCCLTQSDLLELFEESAADGRLVADIIGEDAAAFCDDLIRANGADVTDKREKLNREIREHFQKEGK